MPTPEPEAGGAEVTTVGIHERGTDKRWHLLTVIEAVGLEARYPFIRCDGRDAVGSPLQLWNAPLERPYRARKARFVPLSDFPVLRPVSSVGSALSVVLASGAVGGVGPATR